MTTTLDTRLLLRRSSLTRESVTLLAWFEGATHRLIIDDRLMTFYRHVGGRLEAATASREDDAWTLSSWTLRSVPRLPASAQPLPRPALP